jgi:hypothetical protein
MKESTKAQRRRGRQYPFGQPTGSGDDETLRKAIDDRCDAVRRWIDDDEEEAAVRGID